MNFIYTQLTNIRIAIVPQGGNTSLVGGSVPVFDEVILSTSLMNKIISFNETSGTLICQAGCVLENLNSFLNDYGYMMPLDLGAKGSCQIGGNIATAAGGLRFLRYKSLHANVLGLEVVCADGTIVDNVKQVRKDNTGYHLNQLFIGSEGTLGVITTVCLQVPVKPKSINVVLLGVTDFDSVKKMYLLARQRLGHIISAIEFFDQGSLDLVLQHVPDVVYPLQEKYQMYVLIETHGNDPNFDETALNKFFEEVFEKGIAQDGTLAFDESKEKQLWKLREEISMAIKQAGGGYKYDISIPQEKMYEIVEIMKKRLEGEPDVKVVGFGHLGDGIVFS